MYYPSPASSLLFLFIVSFLYHLPCASSNQEILLSKGFEVKLKIDECEECSSSVVERYELCSKPFICGNQAGLVYPFWIQGREDCGHPDFKLNCSIGLAEVTVSRIKFNILEANHRTLRFARSDYINNLCPTNPIDAPFYRGILQFAPDIEVVTVYYQCLDLSNLIGSREAFIYITSFPCKNDSETAKNYIVIRNNSYSSPGGSNGTDYLNENCKSSVNIPASGSMWKTSNNQSKIFEHGFELELNQDCSLCIESKGACGYNQTSREFVCYCNDGTRGKTCAPRTRSHVSSSVAGVVIFLVLLSLCLRLRRKREIRLREKNLKALIPLKHYTYSQVKRITKSFAEVIGKGGFGIVYKGTLYDGRMVAVKVLKDSKGNGEDFTNEVASMSQTSHLNIVSLLGFCSEGSKRAIMYEYLENGSLDKFISGNTKMKMDWTKLYEIALGVARGLEYLHHGCKTRIVHFDIKPQNVLLDDNFCPKVSDFGLAKLCEKKESVFSLVDARGTIGYIAPEMLSRVYGSVSHKSDVYSYGMLVLEMIGARSRDMAHQDSSSSASSIYFPEWVYKDLELGKSAMVIENGINNEDNNIGIAKKMTLVGLWCIQSSPADRPPMNKVVEMMEGSLDAIEVPPRHVLQIPIAHLQESSTLSNDISF
ncbi:unnamed protein product [Cochlearia groenlandica]